MPNLGLSLEAYLVVDNSFLVMLGEYCCHRWAAKMGPVRLIPTMCRWLTDQFNVLRQFTPDGLVHCTDCVGQEFNPGAGRLGQVRGIQGRDCRSLANHVCSLVHQTRVEARDIAFLHTMPGAPTKLVDRKRLSDNDLSLAVLGSHLTEFGTRVYVLTGDQDLLCFISWVRTRPEARSRWSNIGSLQGLQYLTYLELVHRNCQIITEQMQDLLNFSLVAHYARRELVGTTKGEFILQQLIEITNSLTESVRIKAILREATL